MSKNKQKPNWLLRALIGVSLGIHLVIFMHIAGVYRSNALTYIEFALRDISKSPSRNIPRPRHRPKTPEQPTDIKKLNIRKMIIPRLKPMNVDPAESDISDSLMEQVSMPDDLGLKITDWQPGAHMNTSDYVTSNDYFEMVRLKIERHKKYPDAARARHIEGQTVIGFVIAPDGRVTAIKVARSSGKKTLDRAALNAVKNASPFPKPPFHLFDGPTPLEITIAFELI